MKTYSLFAVIFLLLLLFTMPVMAGDTYNYTVSTKIGENYVLYYGTVDMSSDSIGNHYTQAMFIQELTQANAYAWAWTSNPNTGTEDVNVFVQYSMDRETWLLGTLNSGAINGLDAITVTTPKADTINVSTGVAEPAYAPARWMRFKFDGQTGNTKCTVYWYALFRKGEPYLGSKGESSWYGAMNKI